MRINVFAWIMPDDDLDGYDPITYRASIPAGLTFTVMTKNWHRGLDAEIFDALLTLLPVDSVSTFIALVCPLRTTQQGVLAQPSTNVALA
jgi:hypothetical protein